MNYLLTYPRSGNSAIAKYIQILYPDRLTFGIRPSDRRDRSPKMVAKAITRKAHFRKHIRLSELTKLIIVVRDYKECLMSHYKRSGKRMTVSNYFCKNFPQYADNIVFYNECKSPKLLVYYEDLLRDTRTEMKRVIDFLEEKTDKLDDLIDNLDHYNEVQTKVYKKNTGSVFTGSNLGKKHADNLSPAQIKRFDTIAKNSPAKECLKRYWK